MPNPPMRPQRTVNGETREWDGSQWVPISAEGNAPPRAPMINLPNAPISPELRGKIGETGNWLLKNLLMTGGMMAGGALTGGVIPMIAGAAMGRTAGALPEVALSDDPNKAEALLKEAGTGAMEGLEGEVGARVAGPALRVGGRGLQKLGTMFGDIPDKGAAWRTSGAAGRAALGHYLGLGPVGTTALTVGPPAATELGKLAERTGVRLGETPGLAEPLQEGYEALKRRIWPEVPPTHTDLRAGAEAAARLKYAANAARRSGQTVADEAQQAAREAASGMGPDLGEAGVPLRTRAVRPQADPAELRPDLNQMLEETDLGQQLREAGFERNAAVKIAEGKGTAEGSSLPRPNSWNPSDELGQPYGGITLSDPSARILNTEPTPWSTAPNVNALRSRAIPNAPTPPAKDVLLADDLSNIGRAQTPGQEAAAKVYPDLEPDFLDWLNRAKKPDTPPTSINLTGPNVVPEEPLASRPTTSPSGGLQESISKLDALLKQIRGE
jgi:hypothetical protein